MNEHLAALARDEKIVTALEKIEAVIGRVIAEQAELRDEVHALANRIESVTSRVNIHKDALDVLAKMNGPDTWPTAWRL